MKKLKILFHTEASYTLSGFGIYAKEILSRLHETDKYDIAEFANYGYVNDPRDNIVKWRFYPNAVGDNDPRYQQYNTPMNHFGAWRFERALLDFRPDCQISHLDPWMFMHEELSPLRPYFHRILMPTCDSVPQQEEWIDHFIKADAVFTYTDWAIEMFKKQGGGKMKLQKSVSPGIHLDEFKPTLNKKGHKRNMGLEEDIFIVGTVMRNQRRKLYPDLLLAFNEFLDLCKKENNQTLADKTYLYFHTSYPDVQGCWNLPRLIKESGLGHKILFTYICRNCKAWFPYFFQDAKTACPNCGCLSAMLPSVGNGLDNQQMAAMYNMFDAYTQYANCEGSGMGQIEAASCGIPVFSTDYSGMSDVVRKVNGFPIKVKRMFRSVDEDAYRAMPDNSDFAAQLYKFLSSPNGVRQRRNDETRKGAEKHYNWDNIAKIWEDYFDNVELTGLQGKWDAPPRFMTPSQNANNPPNNLTNEEFIEWAILNILGDESYLDSVMVMDMCRALNYEMVTGINQTPTPYSRQNVIDKFHSMVQNHNMLERARCGMLPLPQEDWIQYAHMKERLN